jgi:diacylglycerol kinase family enzyme
VARIGRVEVVVNLASGSVNEDAPQQAEKIFADFGATANICAPATDELEACLRRAIDAAPDLLVVLAGDGTVRAAAEMAGKDGPMIAPLPGGTMNMLPHAIYGPRAWQDALTIALAEGGERMLGGGEVEGHKFLVAAVLGSPALWAPAREAARFGQKKLAFLRARKALRRAFSGRLRYNLDSGPRDKAEALVFMCPITSRALTDEEDALEAAALDVKGARDAFRLGFHALTGDWRDDPAVETQRIQVARVWSADGVPAILDGESVRLKALTEVRYISDLVRVLAIPKDI